MLVCDRPSLDHVRGLQQIKTPLFEKAGAAKLHRLSQKGGGCFLFVILRTKALIHAELYLGEPLGNNTGTSYSHRQLNLQKGLKSGTVL